jgi:hypothetical protein
LSGLTETDIRLLHARRQRILARLASLSNGTTTAAPDGSGITVRPRADMSTGKGRALATSPGASPKHGGESRLPPGTHGNADMDGPHIDRPPSRNDDLHGHYLWRFKAAAAKDSRSAIERHLATEKICAQAEADYWREVRGPRNVNESGPFKDRRILEEYAGLPNWEVATWEGIHPRAVAKLRRENGYDDEGLEVELDERTRRILALKMGGASQRTIAAEVGISQQRVCQVLAGA